MNKKIGTSVVIFGAVLTVAMIYLTTSFFDVLFSEIITEKAISEVFVAKMTNLGIWMMIIMAYAASITMALGLSLFRSRTIG